MSQKKRDEHSRWRSKNVTFRMSPEEAKQLDVLVKLSGLTKQDYITNRLLRRDIVVQGNPRVYKALKDGMAAVQEELSRIKEGESPEPELTDTIEMIAKIMEGMKGRDQNG